MKWQILDYVNSTFSGQKDEMTDSWLRQVDFLMMAKRWDEIILRQVDSLRVKNEMTDSHVKSTFPGRKYEMIIS